MCAGQGRSAVQIRLGNGMPSVELGKTRKLAGEPRKKGLVGEAPWRAGSDFNVREVHAENRLSGCWEVVFSGMGLTT